MSAEHPLDKFLRNKLNSYEEGFIGSDWEEFSKKLNNEIAKRRKRRLLPVFLTTGLLLPALFAVTLYLTFQIRDHGLAIQDHKYSGKIEIRKTIPDYTYNDIRDNHPKNSLLNIQNSATLSQKKLSHSKPANLLSQPEEGRKNLTYSNKQEFHHIVNTDKLFTGNQLEDDIRNEITADHSPDLQQVNMGMELATVNNTGTKPLLELSQNTLKVTGKKPFAKKSRRKFPVQVGLQATAGYSYLSPEVQVAAIDHSVNKYYPEIEKQSLHKGFNYSYGLIATIPVLKKLNISTGIGRQNWNIPGEYDFRMKETPVYDHLNNEIFYIDNSQSPEKKYNAAKQFSYIYIPLNASFTIPLKNKIQGVLAAGINFNVLKNASGYMLDRIYLTSQPLNGITDLKNSYISWHIGAGIYLPISQKLRLGLLPEYHHCFENVLNSGSGENWYPSAIDIKTTLLFRL